jgi:LmbE family N-acetylglucosaminyl deacetylase
MVLAPHPDDETLGCGGAIRLLIGAQKKIRVIFLTSGEKADPGSEQSSGVCVSGRVGVQRVTDYALMREQETERALRVLGVSDYEFLRYPDRGIYEHYEDALRRLSEAVREFVPDTIYAPSMVELNPDHRAAAALSMEIQRRYMSGSDGSDPFTPITLVFYEVTTPLRPNILVDITSVYSRKKRAMKRYRSQQKLMDYLGHITALNTIRALTVSGPRYVEAFWSSDRPLSGEDISHWLSYRDTLKSGG